MADTPLQAAALPVAPAAVAALVEPLVNKRVDFRFAGSSLTFALSHALFSSFDIDAGTRLLLKVLARQPWLDTVRSAVDLGCGVGVIGIALKKRIPAAEVLMTDRDALAVAFSRYNGRLNGADCAAVHGLGFSAAADRRFDLVVSNLPAKAGDTALAAFFAESVERTAGGGRAAVVIVEPLASFAGEQLAALGVEVLDTEATSGHSVFVYRRRQPDPATVGGRVAAAGRESAAGPAAATQAQAVRVPDLGPYLRRRGRFVLENTGYELATAFNIPDFDTIGHETALAARLCAELLAGRATAVPEGGPRRILIWNPGQGHLAVYLARTLPGAELFLAGRDLLQLEVSALNMAGQAPGPVPAILPAPLFAALREAPAETPFDLIIHFPDDIPEFDAVPGTVATYGRLLGLGGCAVTVAGATRIGRLARARGQLALVADKKHRSARGLVLRKR